MKTLTNTPQSRSPRPANRLKGLVPYSLPPQSERIDLRLDANEGTTGSSIFSNAVAGFDTDQLQRYPSTSELESALADIFCIDHERVLVTNGADDAIDRICRAVLEPGRTLLTHAPSFEMIERSARLAGAGVTAITWKSGAFPVSQLIEHLSESTALVALVSPNNPTGETIALEELLEITRAAADVGAIVMVDLAYVEYADVDPTIALLNAPNVVIIRTFSKALGLAGARVGYAVAAPVVIEWMKTTGGPYPVSSLSLSLALEAIQKCRVSSITLEQVKAERRSLSLLLQELGCEATDSQANFVLARFENASFVCRSLASLGIAVRSFPGASCLRNQLRITLPGNPAHYQRLVHALRTAIAPQAILFDLDGVLADVSGSYREAIRQTARSFSVELSTDDINTAKKAGNANNDWLLTKKLIEDAGRRCTLADVTERFQGIYIGRNKQPGLREAEALIPDSAVLKRLSTKLSLAIVTGRPRSEAEHFLEHAGIRDFFTTLVCMEDAPAKPSPSPVRLAMNELNIERAWMIGDTPDDVVASRLAQAVPLGIVAPGEDFGAAASILRTQGAASVLVNVSQLEEMIK